MGHLDRWMGHLAGENGQIAHHEKREVEMAIRTVMTQTIAGVEAEISWERRWVRRDQDSLPARLEGQLVIDIKPVALFGENALLEYRDMLMEAIDEIQKGLGH